MSDDELDALRDHQIEITIDAVKDFVRLFRPLFSDQPSIDFERFVLCWLASVLWEAGIDAERAAESLRDDGLPLLSDPNLGVNDGFGAGPRRQP